MVNSDNIRFQQHSTTKEESSWRGTSATFESTSSTNVVNTVGNDERQEISRSDEETRGIQEEHRTEHSTTGQSSRTSAIRNGDNGYETTETNVADTEGLRFRGRSGEERGIKKNEFQQTEQKGSSFRSETERRSSQSGGDDDVANTKSIGTREFRHSNQKERSEGSRATQLNGSRGDVANADPERLQRTKQSKTYRGETKTQLSTTQSITTERNHWQFEPDVGRVAHGIPGRVHRLKGLGNSIVPQIVEEIGKALIKGMKREIYLKLALMLVVD